MSSLLLISISNASLRSGSFSAMPILSYQRGEMKEKVTAEGRTPGSCLFIQLVLGVLGFIWWELGFDLIWDERGRWESVGV